jgi:hypothetical protein
MNRRHLEEFGYCRGGTLDRSWPDATPREPVRDVLAARDFARDLATSTELIAVASEALDAEAHPVRANLFVKSEGSNWFVGWHQDRVVCVRRRAEAAGFSGWSVKAGRPHVNAPTEVLREMVAIRLHLDGCPESAGPLEVVPGTHDRVLSEAEIAARSWDPIRITAGPGELLLMRPLLLHRSGRMRQPGLRRVLHVEFASRTLPAPLRWCYW